MPESTCRCRGGRCEALPRTLGASMKGYAARLPGWTEFCAAERRGQLWDAYVATTTKGGNRPNSYAQVIGVVNALCHPRDRIVAAAGGFLPRSPRTGAPLALGTVDVEFGFSCMGYEIAGGWGARIAQAEDEPEKATPSSSSATAPIC
jgi:3D-(3,5/4)-trihydroxycyclohexane-1,2-dione acylhydrolase (decyclizing)